jgi:hypothetical protein
MIPFAAASPPSATGKTSNIVFVPVAGSYSSVTSAPIPAKITPPRALTIPENPLEVAPTPTNPAYRYKRK